MGTSISLGDYEPEAVPEPWEEYQYRDLYRSYYTQSLNMKIGNLQHCITALTALELNKCYTDPEKKTTINEAPRMCYLSALTIYMDNKGKIIKGERVLTKFKLIFNGSEKTHILDSSFKVRKETEACVDGKELHNHVIKNKQISFRNGKVYSLNKFHEYIIQASICNRCTDVNYTNLKVTESRDEINKTLTLLNIGISVVGFVPGKAIAIADYAMKILTLALALEPRASLAEYAYPIKGPVYLDETTIIQEYKRENFNGYISSQRLAVPPYTRKRDVLKELQDWGFKVD